MKLRSAFTMIELIFAIVVMGIIGKFGVEFLAQAYKSFISSTINNTLQAKSAHAVEFVASRLQYRIKDSVIARTGEVTTFTPLATATGETFVVFEWVSSDIDNLRGNTTPNWSGIIDLDAGNANLLVSPATDTGAVNTVISALSNSASGINDAALYFIGADQDINGYGWNGVALANQNAVMHPINSVTGQITQFVPSVGNFTNVNVYEYYQLAWTANAVVIENYDSTTKMGDLVFYYDYQPWNGQTFYGNGKKITIMEDVSTFQMRAIGSIVKLQLCTKSRLSAEETYSLCKEKTVF